MPVSVQRKILRATWEAKRSTRRKKKPATQINSFGIIVHLFQLENKTLKRLPFGTKHGFSAGLVLLYLLLLRVMLLPPWVFYGLIATYTYLEPVYVKADFLATGFMYGAFVVIFLFIFFCFAFIHIPTCQLASFLCRSIQTTKCF
jgi:hypothetical protein